MTILDPVQHPGHGALRDHVMVTVNGREEREAWRYLLDRLDAYPSKMVPALKPPRTTEGPRRLVVCELETQGDVLDGTPVPVSLRTHDGKMPHRVLLGARPDAAAVLAAELFTHRHRGALLVFPGGTASDFAILLRVYARDLVRVGFQLEPLTAGASIRGLIVRKAKHSWVLCDLGVMVGMEGITPGDFNRAFGPADAPREAQERLQHASLAGWQAMSLLHFDSAASVTVGRSAVRAASRHLGPQSWLWRTHPLAVVMLREGGGYRGGYAAAHRFQGQAYRADMNKAYAWALGEPLPSRLGLAREGVGARPAPGLYLARVTGESRIPLYLGTWQGPTKGFERVIWRGGDTLAMLTTTEGDAIERLGYRVSYGTGMSYLSTFALRGFVAQIAGITAMFGRGSPQERIARAYGVSVYGKLAERPQRDQVMYSAESPGDAWRAFVTRDGDEIADLWTAQTVAHRPHQHVDAASEITSLVRARLYDAMGAVVRHGGAVPQADTDGFLSTIDPSPYLVTHDTTPGGWRVTDDTADAIVWGAKGYVYDGEVKAAGLHGVTAEQAARAFAGETVEAEMQERSAPFGDAPLYHPLRRQVRAV